MEPKDEKKLEKILSLVEEDHQMVKKLYRAMRWGRVIKVLYWLIIIGVAVGAFYFLEPVLDKAKGLYSGFGDRVEQVDAVLEQSNSGS